VRTRRGASEINLDEALGAPLDNCPRVHVQACSRSDFIERFEKQSQARPRARTTPNPSALNLRSLLYLLPK